MKKPIFYLTIIIVALILSCSDDKKTELPPVIPPVVPVDTYIDFEYSGFTVKIKKSLAEQPAAVTALTLMEKNLKEINELMPDFALEVMKTRPIWLEKDVNTGGAAWYHPNVAWLEENKMNTDKAKCVEICCYENYVNWSNLNQPYMVLHELSHLYHDLELSFDNEDITAAYENALSTGLYEKIKRYNGNGNYSEERAYALNDRMEYFAELSEAYFGQNDYFPFNYDELKEYDPMGFAVMEKYWGKREIEQ